jgi:hypothetical protein
MNVAGRRAVAGAVLAASLAGCSNAHPGVSNGSVSVCYRAIPPARAAVHEKSATLIGVHRLSADRVRDRLPQAVQNELASENDAVVCAVAFKGNFAPGQVDFASPDSSGTYAVVLVSSRRLHLVGSVVLDQLPSSLGKRTL